MENIYLGKEKILKLLCKFSFPCIISLLIGALYNLVDQIFVGNSEVGILGNAAIGVSFSFVMIAQAFARCFGDGAAAYLNLKQGEKDTKKASIAIGNSIVLIIIISLIVTLITIIFNEPLLMLVGATKDNFKLAQEYLIIVGSCFPIFMFTNMFTSIIRADGSPNLAMLSILSGAIINLILDPIFIYIFKLGIKGAAYATIIGQAISLIFIIIYIFKTKTFKLNKESFRLNFKEMNNAIKLGISSFITQFSIVIVTIVLNISLKKYGEISKYGSDNAQAIFSVLTKVYSIVINIVVGIVLGAQPIIGYNYSIKNYKRVKLTYKYILISTLIVGILSTLIFLIFPKEVISLFGSMDNNLYIEFGIKTFRIYLMFFIFTLFIKMSAIFFQAVGEPLKAVLGALIRDLIIFIPLVISLPFLFENLASGSGIYAILISAPIADLIGLIIALFMNILFFKKINKLDKSSNEIIDLSLEFNKNK